MREQMTQRQCQFALTAARAMAHDSAVVEASGNSEGRGQMIESGEPIHGRGTAENPRPRLLPLTVLRDPDAELDPADDVAPATQFFRDVSRNVIARNASPAVG